MSIDLEKLTPAPWKAEGAWIMSEGEGTSMMIIDDGYHTEADAAFIAIARNAFDVMMRRGWCAIMKDGKWAVGVGVDEQVPWKEAITASDPFTALVEADKWYKENVERRTDEQA